MRIIQVTFMLILFYNVVGGYCDYYEWRDSNIGPDFCKGALRGDGHCCYYRAPKRATIEGCAYISQYEYDNIGLFVKYRKTFGGDNGQTEDREFIIDCGFHSLQFSLMALILLLLWI